MKRSQFCCRHKVKEKLPSPPLYFGQTTANHPATPQYGFTLIGDQKQTIIQAYTSPGKIAKESYAVVSHLTRPQTLTAVKVSKQQPPPPPPASPSPVLLTHNSELSPGCLAKQALTASSLNFERPHWLEHALRPCSSENSSGYLEYAERD